MPKCKRCEADIIWIKTAKGKSMPCDAKVTYYIQKAKGGKQRIVTPNGEVLSCEYTDDPNSATGTGYVPHWYTCPYADNFRKRMYKE